MFNDQNSQRRTRIRCDHNAFTRLATILRKLARYLQRQEEFAKRQSQRRNVLDQVEEGGQEAVSKKESIDRQDEGFPHEEKSVRRKEIEQEGGESGQTIRQKEISREKEGRRRSRVENEKDKGGQKDEPKSIEQEEKIALPSRFLWSVARENQPSLLRQVKLRTQGRQFGEPHSGNVQAKARELGVGPLRWRLL